MPPNVSSVHRKAKEIDSPGALVIDNVRAVKALSYEWNAYTSESSIHACFAVWFGSTKDLDGLIKWCNRALTTMWLCYFAINGDWLKNYLHELISSYI